MLRPRPSGRLDQEDWLVMSTLTCPRRRFAAGAAITVMALVAGCGGASVDDAAPAAAQVVDATGNSTTADVMAPAAVAERGTTGAGIGNVGTVGTVGTGRADATTPAGTAPAQRAAAAGNGSTKRAQNATAGDPGGAVRSVEAVVESAPIFGNAGTCKPATLSEINIGNVSTLSGVLGELFSPVTPALATFVTAQNACGGLNGHKIKYFQSDDQGDPSTAITKITEMIQKNKVLAFVGNIQVLTLDAVVPTIKRYGIPMIGGDSTSNAWFSNSLLFPQGAPVHSVAFGYMAAATQYFKAKTLGDIFCVELPRQCTVIDQAMKELAPQFGLTMAKNLQASLTQPSFVQQCLELKNAGVDAVALDVDAASMVRIARSCTQVGFHPHVMAYPLAVGNEKQFLGNNWLGDTYIPMNVFPWMDDSTPATKYYQAAVRRYNAGADSGGAASLGWSAGALLVAASALLSPTAPTSEQFLDALYQFKSQPFTTLGGLTTPRTFVRGGMPKTPYCLFGAISNSENTGWGKVISQPTCTDVLAPSDPQSNR
jgi:branched-chain amino acid transport system substrate-binding protein